LVLGGPPPRKSHATSALKLTKSSGHLLHRLHASRRIRHGDRSTVSERRESRL
jgi:hypothetical protein